MKHPFSSIQSIPLRRRAGFSFTEVLFAVMVLGIGFIMVAAMFPVTIRQTLSNADDAAGANVAKGAVQVLQSLAADIAIFGTASAAGSTTQIKDANRTEPDGRFDGYDCIVTFGNGTSQASVVSSYKVGVINLATAYTNAIIQGTSYRLERKSFPLTSSTAMMRLAPLNSVQLSNSWFTARGNCVNTQDPRFGWVAMYRRGTTDQGDAEPYAQVIVVVARSRNRARYFATPQPGSSAETDIRSPKTGGYATLEPRLAQISLKRVGLTSQVTFADNRDVVASGAYVIIADDKAAGPTPVGSYNGRIYQIGNPVNGDDSSGIWELVPGSDQSSDEVDLSSAKAYILGRGYTDPANGNYTYSGPAQDIAVYTTFIRVN